MIEKNSLLHLNRNNNFNNIEKHSTKKIVDQKNEKFSLWHWIKGAVNPLQNLPVISGIYSSFKSDDKSSDRDMIQSSAGGFLYGGPIGAFAGFGTWIFRKLFDKTPTELALDTLGISKIWKNKSSISEDDKSIKVSENNSLIKRRTNESKKNIVPNLSSNEVVLIEKKKLINKNINDYDKSKNTSNYEPHNSKSMNFSYQKWRPLSSLDDKNNKQSKVMNLSVYKNINYQSDKNTIFNIKA
mgnify:CR=1 FL=1|tara:strand:+ start:7857 stop:8579 length:723 start_codon:yes stop_codon:yes gene_type:complete